MKVVIFPLPECLFLPYVRSANGTKGYTIDRGRWITTPTTRLLQKIPHRWIETLPSGQKRVFSWIINGLMLKVTISLESHEDEQTCHFNRGSQATLAEGDLVRVTVSN